MTLVYDDERYHTACVNVKESGSYLLTVPRELNSRLKSMSGYVYYFDDDTTHQSCLLLSDLSLKRIHPVKVDKNDL